jgi:cobalamin biosynthetic protein CobC
LVIGAAALRDEAWASQTRAALQAQAERLDGVLHAAGFEIVGGTTLFRLARHGDAGRLHAALAQQMIWTRRFEGRAGLLRFGLPPDGAALARLAAALAG